MIGQAVDAFTAGWLLLSIAAAVGFLLILLQKIRLQKRFQSLVADMHLAEDVSRIGYWSRASESTVAEWSTGMFALFGQDPKTFAPTLARMADLFLPGDWDAIRAVTAKPEAHRKGGEIEARIRCPDGKIKDVLVAFRFRFTKDDRFAGIFGVVADITARKVAERKGMEREEQLQRAVSAMGAAIWDWDIGTDRLYTGRRFAEILGIDPQSFNPTMALHHQLCHPDDLPRIQNAFRKNVATGEPYSVEYRMRHSAGHYVWVHSRGRVVAYDGQRPVRAIGTVVDVTERYQADEELRSSRESLALAMEVSQAGYFDFVMPDNISYWSPRALEILGYAGANFKPTIESLPQLIHPEDQPEFLVAREELRSRNVPLDTQVRVKHSAGHYMWLHVRAIQLKMPEGGRSRTIGLVRDVSTSVLAQRAMADSERKFRNLIEGSLQGVLILRDLKPLFCNQALARIFGYERIEEVLDQDDLLVHVPYERIAETKGEWERALKRELEGKVRRTKILDRAGRSRWIEIVERLIQWEGQPARQLAVLDVTEQEAFQSQLLASEERFRLLADNVSDIITLYDQDQVLRYVSPSIERVAGYKPEEVVGRDMYCLVMPGEEPSREERARLAAEPVLGAHIWRLRHKNGTPIWVESTSSRVPQPDGRRGYAVVSALRDVTERVAREIELGAARDRLKNQADELTILAQNLEMERERAEQANAAKSQFLAMMSHELRTPMTGVMGMADLLLMSELTPEQDDLTKLLKRSARSLLDLLNDILDFSKIEAGQLEIESIGFDLSEVISDIVNLFAPIASERGVVLESRSPPLYWNIIKGDPKRLRQVLSNLVGNAIKFTEAGRITLAFEQIAGIGDSLKLQFSVTDTGIGISNEDLAKLFRPFVQADVSTSRKYGGTGLGLAISRRLVEAMGGDISVTSEVGRGSTFAFHVLVTPDRSVPQTTPQASNRITRSEVMRGRGPAKLRSILFAEDNETSRYLIATMLTRMGHTVDAVSNGAEAVAAARDKKYDIILMDMQMPVMDGPDATREIRKFKTEHGKVPVIALTADIIAAHRADYFAAGVNSIIGKPVDWTELSAEIDRQLDVRAKTAKDADKRSEQKTEELSSTVSKAVSKDVVSADLALDESVVKVLADALGEDILAPMLQTFSANMAKYLGDLGAAVSAGDFNQAKRTAHALKGLCAQFGATRASVLAKFIEMEASGLSDVADVLPQLSETIAAAERALAARRARGEVA